MKAKAKLFPLCTYCGFNNHHPDECRMYPECKICGSYDHRTSDTIMSFLLEEVSKLNRIRQVNPQFASGKLQATKSKEPTK
ncbi:hypothetical protein Tco_1178363, partial [Tanacetum coccineum]